MRWEVPKLWEGRTVYLLGGGPSLNNIDLERLKGERVIAINNAYMESRAPWAPVLYFMDWGWYNLHKSKLIKWPGLKVTVTEKCINEPGIRVISWRHRLGLDPDPSYMTRGTNAGFGAISLAAKLGGVKIILLGFDMRMVDGQHNYHKGEHKRTVNDKIYENNFIKPFKSLLKPMKEWDIEIINATPNSALPYFPIVDPEEVLPDVTNLR